MSTGPWGSHSDDPRRPAASVTAALLLLWPAPLSRIPPLSSADARMCQCSSRWGLTAPFKAEAGGGSAVVLCTHEPNPDKDSQDGPPGRLELRGPGNCYDSLVPAHGLSLQLDNSALASNLAYLSLYARTLTFSADRPTAACPSSFFCLQDLETIQSQSAS